MIAPLTDEGKDCPMNTIDLIVLSRDQYTVLCLTNGFGWGLWVMTLFAAIIIDGVKWRKWINH